MGKKSKKYPSYSSGTISVNGETKATARKNKNSVDTDYNMSDWEKNIFDDVQKGMSNSLSNFFDISDNQRDEWSKQLNSLKTQGIDEINSIYTPMENSLKNDIASRFGNFDNSAFLDSLNSITDKKAKAIADLSDNILTKQDELYNDELKNRINTISFLNNLNSALNNNILNYTSAALSNAESGNNYNKNAYNAMASSGGGLGDIMNAISKSANVLSFLI